MAGLSCHFPVILSKVPPSIYQGLGSLGLDPRGPGARGQGQDGRSGATARMEANWVKKLACLFNFTLLGMASPHGS